MVGMARVGTSGENLHFLKKKENVGKSPPHPHPTRVKVEAEIVFGP